MESIALIQLRFDFPLSLQDDFREELKCVSADFRVWRLFADTVSGFWQIWIVGPPHFLEVANHLENWREFQTELASPAS